MLYEHTSLEPLS